MKALSIRQPWAWAIVQGWKPVENRRWRTPYRGPLAIHAPLTEDVEDLPGVLHLARMQEVCRTGTSVFPSVIQQLYRDTPGPLGHIVGVADLVDCVEGRDPDGHLDTWSDNPWFTGPWGLVLRNARPVKPIPLRGRLGIFDADVSLEGAP